jgi:hypothetical protein
MKCSLRLGGALALALMFSVGVVARAEEKAPSLSSQPAKVEAPKGEIVELFAAAAKGDIEVRLIPKDSTTGQVIITNKTKKPLTIQLPEAFAGVPVLAQGLGGGGFGGGGGLGGGGNQNQQNQGMGGGGMMGGGMMGGGGGFGGGGMFNIGPEKVGKLRFKGVCLEHGKIDPNPRVPYTMIPLESFTSKGEVIEIVRMLSKGEIDQHTAQAAAWHFTNDMSWQELANKVGKKHLDGRTEPYFTHAQLEVALRITREAAHRSAEAAKKNPTSKPVKSLADK